MLNVIQGNYKNIWKKNNLKMKKTQNKNTLVLKI